MSTYLTGKAKAGTLYTMAKYVNKYKVGDFTLRVGRSASGNGLFATTNIPKGSCVIEYIGRPVGKKEQERDQGKYLFWITDTEMINGNIPANTARYINHSCAPNCQVEGPDGRIFIMTLRNIQAGEELTYDYGDEYFDKHIRPKGCRCSKCIK
jgi:uncharacterized protein